MNPIKIINGHFDQVSWVNSIDCDFVMGNNVDTWKINVSSNLTSLDACLAIMQPEEIAAAGRFFHTNDKNRFIITRGAVRIILGKYLSLPPETLKFDIIKNKKPFVVNSTNTDLHFNISHSGDWIMLAVSDLEVGADTEFLNHLFNYKEIMYDYFSDPEANFIKQKTPVDRFFLLWTRKEALIKATGKGLVDNIESLPGLDGTHTIASDIISSTDDWLISSFKLEPDYIASIAYDPSISKTSFFSFNF